MKPFFLAVETTARIGAISLWAIGIQLATVPVQLPQADPQRPVVAGLGLKRGAKGPSSRALGCSRHYSEAHSFFLQSPHTQFLAYIDEAWAAAGSGLVCSSSRSFGRRSSVINKPYARSTEHQARLLCRPDRHGVHILLACKSLEVKGHRLDLESEIPGCSPLKAFSKMK